MTEELTNLLLAVAASALGAWAVLKRRPPRAALVGALLLYAFLGVHAVLASWATGSGLVLPTVQISPGLRSWYMAETVRGNAPALPAGLLLLAFGAHALVAFPRRALGDWVAPAAATALFLLLWLRIDARAEEPPIPYVRAEGPRELAWLTAVPLEKGARIVVSRGDPEGVFCRVLHVHETETLPPPLSLDWTRDGEVIVVKARGERMAAFALERDGTPTGLLPSAGHEWPRPPEDYVPPQTVRVFQEARKKVDALIRAHGGLFIP